MTADAKPPEGWSLERWSRRKREASREKAPDAVPSASAAAPVVEALPPAPTNPAAISAGTDALPPVESLTIESDFSAFLKPKVDEAVKRQALKQLFRDPRFNVMDGLDVYIDDYSLPDPIEPDVVRQMVQGRYIFDPPPTRINAQGFAEDVPAEELALAKADSIEAPADPSIGAGDAIVAGSPRPPVEASRALPEASPSEAPDGPSAQ